MPNALTPAYGASSFSATQSVSVNFGTNSNRGLLGIVFWDNNIAPNVDMTSVVIDPGGAAVTCTLGARRNGSTVLGVQGGFYAFWASGASVPTGTKTVTATHGDGNGKPRMWCLPLDDVASIGAEAVATGFSTSPGVSVSSAAGATVYGMFANLFILDSETVTPGTGTTSIARVLYTAAGSLAGGIWQEAGATSVTLDGSYTGSIAQWAMTAWSVSGSAGDVTPPTLSSPAGTGGTLLCSGSVSTNEANGALWAVATASATAPTGVQVEAGQDHTGAAALRVISNQAVTATGVQTIASGAVSAGTRFLHFMHRDAAGNRSAVVSSGSFTVSAAGDTTPPTLTSPVGTGGTLVCSGSVSTDEANGALWAVVTASATAPSGVQVEGGQDHTGAAALRAISNQAVTATGAQTIASGAVTAGTRFMHFMHRDAAGNRSAVVSSASFTVSAAGDTTPPTLTSPVGTGGQLVCSGSVSTNEANGVLWAVVTASATAPTGVQVEAGQDHTGAAALRAISNQAVTATGAQTIASGAVTAGTRFMHFMHRDAAGNRSAVVSSTSFTVTSPPTFSTTFGPFTTNNGAGTRAPGVTFDWWAFQGVVIGGDIDAAVRRRGSGTLNASGLAVISGLPAAGSWETQIRFPGDAEPEKGTARDTLTAA